VSVQAKFALTLTIGDLSNKVSKSGDYPAAPTEKFSEWPTSSSGSPTVVFGSHGPAQRDLLLCFKVPMTTDTAKHTFTQSHPRAAHPGDEVF